MPTKEVKYATLRAVGKIYRNGAMNKAVLADFRNATSIDKLRSQDSLEAILSSLEEEDLSVTGNPSKGEKAAFGALHLYAIAQQRQIASALTLTKKEHDTSLFAVLGKLRYVSDELRISLDRVLKPVLTRPNYEMAVRELSHALKIAKQHVQNMNIDFAQLAGDLYYMQYSLQSARKVQLLWAQKYYRPYNVVTSKENKENAK
ncbi:type I-E CRISPR-associated protein Cse2/CasB [Ligilactobacillus equi]|uniref:Uncharacterized protein n=1 Tax=Ligilactobacillus equi DPC 6820 TaxID=1392007 RepID=V7HWT7_9LACO|nr:type I-E CRISPR-associated protein Cse2/CasB [Ligilactobacillus equi]ETA73745.1 hypothetical protein LEQ_0048c [Ligilactobacillus equi DPC 6820]